MCDAVEAKQGNLNNDNAHSDCVRNNRIVSIGYSWYCSIYQVWKQVMSEFTKQSCGTCSNRKGISDFYAPCDALAAKHWLKSETRLPFWTPFSMLIIKDMTVRTLATEGKTCAAYISMNSLAADMGEAG